MAYFGLDSVDTEDRDGLAIAHTGRALNGTAFLTSHRFIQSGQAVVVEPGKVQLTNVSGIVHVTDENVHVLRCTEACEQKQRS